MKKTWIIWAVIIATVAFLYSMWLLSSQNTCTGVRAFTCTASQKAGSTTVSSQQQQAAATVNTRTRVS